MTPPRGGERDSFVELEEIRRRSRNRRRARVRRRHRVGVVAGTALTLLLLGLLTVGLTGAAAIRSRCDLSSLNPVAIGENSFIYAADGSLLATIPSERNRQPITMDRISKWMPKATVAIEDRRFYRHGGLDVEGIARAAWADLRARKVVQGGSTITQQLVRNLYPVSRERTLTRKAKEACLAVKLDRKYDKRWILESYMNQVYYGNQAYGVEAAAQTYFSRRARGLTMLQAALLAGLPQAPSVFDPFRYPERALDRRNAVLRAMLATGAIPLEQYTEAVADEDLHLKAGRLYKRIREPYAFSYVVNQLKAEYGAETVRTGGLRVYTTINPRFQRLARKAIEETLYLKDDPAAALVSINPRNGAIRAMTAVTPGKVGNQFNLASQARRQAGSTFKTFVLTTAVEEGVNPDTTGYESRPFHYQPDPFTPAWEVETYGGDYLGWTTIARATLASDNTVYAQLTLDLGPENVAATAHKMGIQTSLKTSEGAYVPSMGLGSIEVSPLEMASAYATLAAGGIYSKPFAIRRVVLPSGEEDTEAPWGEVERQRVLPDWVAYEVTRILEQNVTGGTGTQAYFGRPAAGKTGTTDRHTDAWFCGYTPNLMTAVWVGYPVAQIPMESVHGISVAGGTFPAIIWRLFMSGAIGDTPYVDFGPPTTSPDWRPFTRGQYANTYSDYTPPSAPAAPTTTTTTTKAAAPKPPPPPPPPPPPSLPPTTEPPPPPPPTEPPVTTTGPTPP